MGRCAGHPHTARTSSGVHRPRYTFFLSSSSVLATEAAPLGRFMPVVGNSGMGTAPVGAGVYICAWDTPVAGITSWALACEAGAVDAGGAVMDCITAAVAMGADVPAAFCSMRFTVLTTGFWNGKFMSGHATELGLEDAPIK